MLYFVMYIYEHCDRIGNLYRHRACSILMMGFEFWLTVPARCRLGNIKLVNIMHVFEMLRRWDGRAC